MTRQTYDLKLCPTYCLAKIDQLVSIPKLLIPRFELFSINVKYLVGHYDLKVNSKTQSSTGVLLPYSSSCQWSIIFLLLLIYHFRRDTGISASHIHECVSKRQLIRQRVVSTIAEKSITFTVDKTDECTTSLHYQQQNASPLTGDLNKTYPLFILQINAQIIPYEFYNRRYLNHLILPFKSLCNVLKYIPQIPDWLKVTHIFQRDKSSLCVPRINVLTFHFLPMTWEKEIA